MQKNRTYLHWKNAIKFSLDLSGLPDRNLV